MISKRWSGVLAGEWSGASVGGKRGWEKCTHKAGQPGRRSAWQILLGGIKQQIRRIITHAEFVWQVLIILIKLCLYDIDHRLEKGGRNSPSSVILNPEWKFLLSTGKGFHLVLCRNPAKAVISLSTVANISGSLSTSGAI
jgi:hypothetical protein